jgi:membrane fusion protein, multidrug efflux system
MAYPLVVLGSMRHAHGIAALAVSLVLAVLAGCGQQAAEAVRPPAEVVVQQVEPRTIPVVASRVAQTESSRQVEVVARVSGFLETIAYREGGMVREGEVMFQMDRTPFEAQLEMAEGELRARRWPARPRRTPTSRAPGRWPRRTP